MSRISIAPPPDICHLSEQVKNLRFREGCQKNVAKSLSQMGWRNIAHCCLQKGPNCKNILSSGTRHVWWKISRFVRLHQDRRRSIKVLNSFIIMWQWRNWQERTSWCDCVKYEVCAGCRVAPRRKVSASDHTSSWQSTPMRATPSSTPPSHPPPPPILHRGNCEEAKKQRKICEWMW